MGGFGDAAAMDSYDDFEPKKGGALKWVVLLLLAGGGAGGFMWWQGQQKAAAEQADAAKPAGPAKTIQAVAVPEDTEDIKTAKGQDVDKLPGAEIKKNKRRGGGGGGGGGSKSSSHSTGTKKRKDGKIKLSDSDDPLG